MITEHTEPLCQAGVQYGDREGREDKESALREATPESLRMEAAGDSKQKGARSTWFRIGSAAPLKLDGGRRGRS